VATSGSRPSAGEPHGQPHKSDSGAQIGDGGLLIVVLEHDMSTFPEKIACTTASRYESVLSTTATDLLASSTSKERHLRPPILERNAESTSASLDPGQRPGAQSLSDVIRGLARVVAAICRWTYERVAL
jgi:hypothetical protein